MVCQNVQNGQRRFAMHRGPHPHLKEGHYRDDAAVRGEEDGEDLRVGGGGQQVSVTNWRRQKYRADDEEGSSSLFGSGDVTCGDGHDGEVQAVDTSPFCGMRVRGGGDRRAGRRARGWGQWLSTQEGERVVPSPLALY
jgi:hypothetical protein